MKKNLIIVLLLCLVTLLSGCVSHHPTREEVEDSKQPILDLEKQELKYYDENQTPISFYRLDGNKLIKLTELTANLSIEEDIGIFQIFPSTEDEIILNKSFADSFYDEWQKYNINNTLKIGFNIKFKLENENISYNILNPTNTFDHWEYLMNYLYDDYANRGKGFYSHIEDNEYTDSTLFTALKIQSSYQCADIVSPIQVSVYTYDSIDDFENNEYRGNSQSSFIIYIG